MNAEAFLEKLLSHPKTSPLMKRLIGLMNFNPASIEEITPTTCVSSHQNPKGRASSTFKVLSWNVQYLAGKNYVFYYDILDESGPDLRPSSEDIFQTRDETAAVILKENPDFVLLQEVDEGAKRTDFKNQTQLLQEKLNGAYPHVAECFYWKSLFVPHPKIMGPVGMKLVTLSRHPIKRAKRISLPLMKQSWLKQQFYLKRAVLECEIDFFGKKIIVSNTHLDAFAQNSNTMELQVKKLRSLLSAYDQKKLPWVIGGDFNLLMPGNFSTLPKDQQAYFNQITELALLSQKFLSFPSASDTLSKQRKKTFTHYPNDPSVKGPDRTIDYLFYSKRLTVTEKKVRQSDTLALSDHLPVILKAKI